MGHGADVYPTCNTRRFASGNMTWAYLLINNGENTSKYLIYKKKLRNARFLWITLLISPLASRQRRINQGSDWAALKKSNIQNLYKSITYERYCFYSAGGKNKQGETLGTHLFVHKWKCRTPIGLKKVL
jgi:hypothetical protein